MKQKSIIFSLIVLSLVIVHLAPEVSAQIRVVQPSDTGFRVESGASGSTLLQNLISNVITIIYSVSGIAVVIFVLWGAFDWITSGGNKDKIGSAQKKITTALIGLAVLALSFVIIFIVGSIVGFNPVDPNKSLQLPTLDPTKSSTTSTPRK